MYDRASDIHVTKETRADVLFPPPTGEVPRGRGKIFDSSPPKRIVEKAAGGESGGSLG